MEKKENPGLFGLRNSNRNFSLHESWGKNQFNSSFPASLLCYMGYLNIPLVYLTISDNWRIQHSKVTAEEVLGLPYHSNSLFFSFEEPFTPFSDLVIGRLPRADLVTRDISKIGKDCLALFEIKLTTLPDTSTFHLDESLYGCEIVIRPNTIIYIALSIAQLYRSQRNVLENLVAPVCEKVKIWEDSKDVREYMQDFLDVLQKIVLENLPNQSILLLQPVGKTLGKKGGLADNCYDIFLWSNFSLIHLLIEQSKFQIGNFTRSERAIIWLVKMLEDFSKNAKINSSIIIDSLTYNTKNDKAFSVNGKITHSYLQSEELTKPRISKFATKEIILGGGQNYLSPERRLDAVILNSPDLFE